MRHLILITLATLIGGIAPVGAQELKTTRWASYDISFLAPEDIEVEDDSEEGYIVSNPNYYITVQLLAGEGIKVSELPQELKNIAADDEVTEQTDVTSFELPQFYGAKLTGNCESERCVYSYLMAKDASCGFYVSIVCPKVHEQTAESILHSFKMEE